jgi:hypothetical protein
MESSARSRRRLVAIRTGAAPPNWRQAAPAPKLSFDRERAKICGARFGNSIAWIKKRLLRALIEELEAPSEAGVAKKLRAEIETDLAAANDYVARHGSFAELAREHYASAGDAHFEVFPNPVSFVHAAVIHSSSCCKPTWFATARSAQWRL